MHQPHQTTLNLSRHAEARQRQRGIPTAVSRLLLAEADREAAQHGGRVLLWLSSIRLTELRAEGVAPSLLEKAASLFLVQAEDGTIITMLNHRSKTATRRKRARAASGGHRDRASGRGGR